MSVVVGYEAARVARRASPGVGRSISMMWPMMMIAIGLVLFMDGYCEFYLGIGRFLPDFSAFHIEPFGFVLHHWMYGLGLVIAGVFLMLVQVSGRRRK